MSTLIYMSATQGNWHFWDVGHPSSESILLTFSDWGDFCRKDLRRSWPKEVLTHSVLMIMNEKTNAMASFKLAMGRNAPINFCVNTLAARMRVIVTDTTRKMLAHNFCGEADINWGSLRQMRRQIAKKGRRQPLNTWAIRITCTRGAEIKIHHYTLLVYQKLEYIFFCILWIYSVIVWL